MLHDTNYGPCFGDDLALLCDGRGLTDSWCDNDSYAIGASLGRDMLGDHITSASNRCDLAGVTGNPFAVDEIEVFALV